MDELKMQALKRGASDLIKSSRKNNKWAVKYNGKWIHFGHPAYQDFTQHHDPERRRRYLARATMIRNKYGNITATDPNTANYWAINLLW